MSDAVSLFSPKLTELESKDLSYEDYKSYLAERVQELVDQEFKDCWQKKSIKVCYDRIQCACPICRDSSKSLTKKRGNFILKGDFAGHFKCFNCGSYLPIPKLFERFGKTLNLDCIDYIAKSEASSGLNDCRDSSSSMSFLFDDAEVEKIAISKEKLKSLGLVECSEQMCRGTRYLQARHIKNLEGYMYYEKRDLLFLLNMTPQKKAFGMQIRKMAKGSQGPKYLTYSITNMYKTFFKEDVKIEDHNMEAMSMLFNIFNINPSKPVLVTEGPFDASFLPNAIATTGANKNLILPLPFWFVYDSDKTGVKKAIEKIEQGYKVFLWDRLKADLMLPKREKWDVNDVVNWCIENKKPMPKWMNYFSNDKWDALDI